MIGYAVYNPSRDSILDDAHGRTVYDTKEDAEEVKRLEYDNRPHLEIVEVHELDE